MTYELYKVKGYFEANDEYIRNNGEYYNTVEEIINLLMTDNYYHFRIHKKQNYIFFGDLDNYNDTFSNFSELLINFMKLKYDVEIKKDDIKYTQNNQNINSYHYSIPNYYCSSEKLHEIIKNFKEKYIKDYKIEKKCIDTSIYSEHWFRCPNQSKGKQLVINNQHIIKKGDMKDFIVYHIPHHSENIENKLYIEDVNEKNIVSTKIINKKNKDLSINATETVLSTIISQPNLYKSIFDNCYSQERFEMYEYWLSVGMALKNSFQNDEEAFNLFDYFSSKGKNYEGTEKTRYKYFTLIKKENSNGFTSATIYYYAIEDNKPKFIEIMNKNTFELGQTDICKYLKIVGGHNFIYKKNKNVFNLYCFNGKYWENNNIEFRKFLSNDLYEFLKRILIEVYWNNKEFNALKNKIEKLKTISFKKEIEETYKEYGVDEEVKFDDKWYLFGFNNVVYDLNEEMFREYKYDDYIATTTGYNWREPTDEEINTVIDLIKSIMPNEEERNLLLQILCTSLEGRCLERFVVFNGGGGNGKGVLNDILLKAVGNYGLIGNNGILSETSKTGSNPEKANIHKKRIIIFREPPEKTKFQNSIVKELTGGGTFSARTHQEKETEKELNNTTIVECNKKPTFDEEPTDADLRRVIDILFASKFTENKEEINADEKVFLANIKYKLSEFQDKHKFALLKILFDAHKEYKKNSYMFNIPKVVQQRTRNYLELSCNILQWFKDNYELLSERKEQEKNEENTDDETLHDLYSEDKHYIKLKDLFEEFKMSDYYYNLTKAERRKYNKSYFVNYFQTDNCLKKHYKDRKENYRTIIIGWIKKRDSE